MDLSNLQPAKGSVKKGNRVGRGEGSKKGGTSGRGHKGAKSRSGYSKKQGFEGGQMPLQRRVPKFGFKNPNRVEYVAINLDTLQRLALSCGDNFEISFPSIITEPDFKLSNPSIAFIAVDFPAPFGPRIETISPLFTLTVQELIISGPLPYPPVIPFPSK